MKCELVEITLDYASDDGQIPSPIHDAQWQEDDDPIHLPPQPNGSAHVEREDMIKESTGKGRHMVELGL